MNIHDLRTGNAAFAEPDAFGRWTVMLRRRPSLMRVWAVIDDAATGLVDITLTPQEQHR